MKSAHVPRYPDDFKSACVPTDLNDYIQIKGTTDASAEKWNIMAEWLAPVYPSLSAHFVYRRLAVHLHMSVGRVVFSPHRIGWVPSQLVINWAPFRTEPSIKIIKVYGKIVF